MNIIFRFRTSKNISRNKMYPKKGVGNSASVLPSNPTKNNNQTYPSLDLPQFCNFSKKNFDWQRFVRIPALVIRCQCFFTSCVGTMMHGNYAFVTKCVGWKCCDIWSLVSICCLTECYSSVLFYSAMPLKLMSRPVLWFRVISVLSGSPRSGSPRSERWCVEMLDF